VRLKAFEYLRQNHLKSNGIKSYVSVYHHSTKIQTEKPWLCTSAHRRLLDNSLSLSRKSSLDSQKLVQFLIQEKKMTQAQKDQESTQQQHHEKAAEHHEQASKHHKEAVKHHESGDEKTAAHHAHIAHGHSAQATEQETEASKKYAKTHSPKK
jgi:hypothetical protein